MVAKNAMQRARRDNLSKLIDKWHGTTPLAKHLGLSGPSYLSQLAGGTRPFSEKTARKFEEKLGLPLGALDAMEGAPAAFAGTDHSLIAASVRAVGEELGRHKITLSSQKFAELVAVVYEHAVSANGKIDSVYISKVIKLAS